MWAFDNFQILLKLFNLHVCKLCGLMDGGQMTVILLFGNFYLLLLTKIHLSKSIQNTPQNDIQTS